MARYLVGIDVGGTFTDFVAFDRDDRHDRRLEEPDDAGRIRPTASSRGWLASTTAPRSAICGSAPRSPPTPSSSARGPRSAISRPAASATCPSSSAATASRTTTSPGSSPPAGQAPPLPRDRRAHRPRRRGLEPLDEAGLRADRAPAEGRGPRSRRSPSACCSPSSSRSTSGAWRRSSPRNGPTCRSPSPTTCCRAGRNMSAPRPPSPTPISSRRSARYLATMHRRLRDAGFRGSIVVIKSNGGEETLDGGGRDRRSISAVSGPSRRRHRRPPHRGAHRHRAAGDARHGRHLDRLLDGDRRPESLSQPTSRSSGACRSRCR